MQQKQTIFSNLRNMPFPLWIILSGFFFVNCGANMVIPFFGLYVTQYMHVTAAQAGLVLTVTVGTPRALALLGGAFSDKFGIRQSMMLGLGILVISAIGYSFSHSLWAFILNSFISGVGFSLFTPAGKAAVSSIVSNENRMAAFALRNMAVNIGVAAGPIIGMWITVANLRITFLLTAIVYGVFFIFVSLFLRQESQAGQSKRVSGLKKLRFVFQDQKLMVYSVLIITFYILLAQFSLVLPLYAADRFGAHNQVGLLFTANALIMIAVQYPILSYLSKYLSAVQISILGIFFTALGLGGAGLASQFSLLFITLVVFTVGQLLIMPSIDSVVSEYAPAELAASYQGFSGLAGAVGGIIGNLVGGSFYGWAKHHLSYESFWLSFFIFGCFVCICYALAHRSYKKSYYHR